MLYMITFNDHNLMKIQKLFEFKKVTPHLIYSIIKLSKAVQVLQIHYFYSDIIS